VLTDKGLAGRDTERYATEQVNVLLVRPDRRDEPRRFGNLAGSRLAVEMRHPWCTSSRVGLSSRVVSFVSVGWLRPAGAGVVARWPVTAFS